MRFADLHLHSHFSDGTYRPAELAAHARRCELAAIALTDHDSVEGCAGTAEACAAVGIEFVPGTELTAEEGGDEVHLLGYFVDTQNAKLLAQIATFQEVRQNRIREIVARLNRLRVPLKAEAVFALADCRSPGRPHVARALVAARLCSTLDEAFDRFLKRNRPAWVPKFKMGGKEAIELIHQAGGVAVLAHPGLNRTDGVIPGLVEAGMDGIECYHTKHPPSLVTHYLELAAKLHLLMTGGSDCHGLSKGKPLIGTVRVPYQYVEALRARAAEVASTALHQAAP
jgi:3',5'-nucleoside bisphosphate phosphatase